MSVSPRKLSVASVEPALERASRSRQRQRLIEASITALHLYGPSRTTVEKVVGIAEMSPGIVSFYFDSKAAMLVAALDFLATEFEQKLLEPVAALSDRPVEALDRLVELYLDPDLASPRKISVWYAFWGESTSRKEYSALCEKKDDAFAALVLDLIRRVIALAGRPELDADGVALGLIGALEMLWQGFAFRSEAEIDRPAAIRRCRNYLRSVFPAQFPETVLPPATLRLPGAAYASADRFRREAALFLADWHHAGAATELTAPGDWLATDLLGERALILRLGDGTLRGFDNRCSRQPHALVLARSGHFEDGIRCAVDDIAYEADGTALRGLPVLESGGAIYVRFAAGAGTSDGAAPDLTGLVPQGEPSSHAVAADWKIVVEQWLDLAEAAPIRFHPPGLLVETRPDGATLLQLLPVAAGQSRILRRVYGAEDPASRLSRDRLDRDMMIAESTQQGVLSAHYVPMEPASAALRDFRQRLATRMPTQEEPSR